MKNKLFILSVLTSVFAVGCSEGGYTPSTSNPSFNSTGIPNTSNPNVPLQNYPYNTPLNQPNNLMPYVPYQQQNMLSWNMRLNIPGFYNNNYLYRNCFAPQPYYTTCTQTDVRPVVVTTHHDCSSCNDTVDTSDTDTVVTTTDSDKTKVYPISWLNEDAQALYQRLAKEELTTKTRALKADVKARTGVNIKCIVDGKESTASNYVCDVHIRAKDGMLLQQTDKNGQPGKDAAPETAISAYKGDLLNIGITGQSPEIGYLVVAGPSAKDLYADLSVDAVEGKVEEAGNIDAKIKTLGQVKCYETTKTTSTLTECVLKINSITGAAINF